MSEQEPSKRLVGRKQYVVNIAARILGRSAVAALLVGGLLSFGVSIFVLALWRGNAVIAY